MSFRRLKEAALVELERLRRDPFGETSIDPHVLESEFQGRRAVNSLQEDIQSLVRLPVAIKSTFGPEKGYFRREDLVDQFIFMRELQFRARECLLEQQRETIEFLPVYGVIKTREQDFLIMKRIEGGTEIADCRVRFLSYGWPGSGDPDYEPAFYAKDHQDLLEAMGLRNTAVEPIRWRYITQHLGNQLGLRLHDLAGRNVLYYQEEDRQKYVVIDQVRDKIC